MWSSPLSNLLALLPLACKYVKKIFIYIHMFLRDENLVIRLKEKYIAANILLLNKLSQAEPS